MSRLFYHVMQDNAGNLLFDVSGTMRLAGTGTLATIYGDEALTIIISNPMTNHPSFGSFKCFLGAGDYDFYMAKSGYTFETLTGVQGHGTMAQQDADAVAITGGVIQVARVWTTPGPDTPKLVAQDITGGGPGVGVESFVTAGTNRWNLRMTGTAQNYCAGPLGLGPGYTAPEGNFRLSIDVDKAAAYGIKFRHSSNDTGGAQPVVFSNVAGTDVGSISTTGSATAYNTSSDVRLKRNVTTLVGELAVIRALRPVRFRWLADDSEGVGFLAQEVAEHVQGVVSGEPDAVDDEGQIVPQQIDYSKLVPWLVGALQTLAGQVETLAERVQALETALGV